MECPVCYDAIESGATTTPCGHTYHSACLSSWLERANTCPSCRTVVAAAPTNPNAEPVWLQWLVDLQQRMDARLVSMRSRLDSIGAGIAEVQAKLDAVVEANKTKRSEAAKRGWATRRANKAALVTV
jgi:Zinc finger, C3HC4 type (RING finger)